METATIETLERHQTHQLYAVHNYDDTVHTTVTHDPTILTQWITTFNSTYSSSFPHYPLTFSLNIHSISTLHLCINDRCLIFQLKHASHFPDLLKQLLTNPNHTFVGIGVKSDVETLDKEYEIGKGVRVVDLCDLAVDRYGRDELKGYGLEELCEFVLGEELVKPGWLRICTWDRKRLTTHQVMFSTVDALVSYHLGCEMRADEFHVGYAVSAFASPSCYIDELSTKPNTQKHEMSKPSFQNPTTKSKSTNTSIEAVERNPTHQVYNVAFYDDDVRTTVTHDPNKVTEWISKFESTYQYFFPEHLLIFGLDIEWRPGKNPVAILQICINDRCLIFQIIHASYIPDSLKKFLINPAHTFFGVGIKSDIQKLEGDYRIGRNAKIVELGDAAAVRYGRKELKSKGLKYLCKYVLGKDMDKPERVRTSAWDNQRLSDEQVKYACVDVLVCYNIGGELRADKLDKHWKPPAPRIDDHALAELNHPSRCYSCHTEEFSTKLNPQDHEATEIADVETKIYNVMWFSKLVRTTVTNDPSQVTKWISEVESNSHDRLIFGFDVEWRPASASGHQNPVATLQICIKERCLIFQIIHSPHIPDSLKHFLANRTYTFVGGDVEPDLLKLKEDYQLGRNMNAVDAGDLAHHRYGSLDLKYCGLKNLYRHVFGKEMQKVPSVSSEWDNRTLTTDQVKFACYVAVVSYEIAIKLRADDFRYNLHMRDSPIAYTGFAMVAPF